MRAFEFDQAGEGAAGTGGRFAVAALADVDAGVRECRGPFRGHAAKRINELGQPAGRYGGYLLAGPEFPRGQIGDDRPAGRLRPGGRFGRPAEEQGSGQETGERGSAGAFHCSSRDACSSIIGASDTSEPPFLPCASVAEAAEDKGGAGLITSTTSPGTTGVISVA